MVWRLSGFDQIFDAEHGFCKKIGVVYGFSVAMRLRKNGIQTNGWRFFAYSVAKSGLFRPRDVAFHALFTG